MTLTKPLIAHLGPINWSFIFILSIASIMWGYVKGSHMTRKPITPESSSQNFMGALHQATQSASQRLRNLHKGGDSR